MTMSERRYFAGYIITASALMILIMLLQSYKYEIFGTRFLLGWDSPAYVWLAKYVTTKGGIRMSFAWGNPYFYTQLSTIF